MRLINVHTLELKAHADNAVPAYYILSHRWLRDEDEVTLEEYPHQHALYQRGQKTKRGFEKVAGLCRLVRSPALHITGKSHAPAEWVWVDTCCIDKRSSSELSESINSMARWYRDARLCVAFLADVPKGRLDWMIWKSEWFTRGWCLQELLFPEEIVFCDGDWNIFGSKTDERFRKQLAARTGIEVECLRDRDTMLRQCVAKKMSWASRRVTKRTEDLAYCLLGLFNIQMALLYGEGTNAFARLQEEIVRQTDDESIFAWTLPKAQDNASDDKPGEEWALWTVRKNSMLVESPSVFAPHPRYFGGCWRAHPAGNIKRPPYQITNKGLEFQSQTWLVSNPRLGADRVAVIELNCGNVVDVEDRSCLMVLGEMSSRGRYQRLEIHPAVAAKGLEADGYTPANPRLTVKGLEGDGYMWRLFHGFDAENTTMNKSAGTLYIQALSSVKSLGGQGSDGGDLTTLAKVLNERAATSLASYLGLKSIDRQRFRLTSRGRSSSHSPRTQGEVGSDQEYVQMTEPR